MSRVACGRASDRAAVDCCSICSGWSTREKISRVSRSAVSSILRNHTAGARALHFLRVTQLVAVGGGSEGNEDGGAARGCDFRRGDGSCSANDHICPGKALGHIREEGDNLRIDLAPRVRGAHRIIIAFAGLVHDRELIFSWSEQVHGIDKCTVDRQGSLATACHQQPERLFGAPRHDREKLRAHRTARNDGFFSPGLGRNFIAGGNPFGELRATIRFVRPGSAFGSKITLGTPT